VTDVHISVYVHRVNPSHSKLVQFLSLFFKNACLFEYVLGMYVCMTGRTCMITGLLVGSSLTSIYLSVVMYLIAIHTCMREKELVGLNNVSYFNLSSYPCVASNSNLNKFKKEHKKNITTWLSWSFTGSSISCTFAGKWSGLHQTYLLAALFRLNVYVKGVDNLEYSLAHVSDHIKWWWSYVVHSAV